jgi:hypothetical protein
VAGAGSRLARVKSWATAAWLALLGGGGLGFLARDVLHGGRPAVALAWTLGAALAAGPVLTRRRRGRRGGPRGDAEDRHAEVGQASIEWVGLVLLSSLALTALAAVGPPIDGRSFGGFLAHRFVCAAQGGCEEGQRALAEAYGPGVAGLVREHAPNLVYERGERRLPVDWRRCRRPECASADDHPDLDVHGAPGGARATAFTRVLRRGERTYLQYWLYYPDSTTTWASSDRLWEWAWQAARGQGLVDRVPAYPGAHRDDWESYAVRLDPDGRARVRASSHGHWQGCKELECRNEWTRSTGWTRVSRGSHAGHIPLRHELRAGARWVHPRQIFLPGMPRNRMHRIPLLPGHDLNERTTTGEGLRLVPLETLDARGYRPVDEDVRPPWQKDAYWDPESDES